MIMDYSILDNFRKDIDEMNKEFQIMYLASAIVDGTFDYFKIERNVYNVGRPPFDLKNMTKLKFYGFINKITSSVQLAYQSKYNEVYNLISHGCQPSDRTIRDYSKFFDEIFQYILSFILIVANKLGLTDFEHISIDGTIKNAYNSSFNIIKEKDIRLLIKHFMVEELSKEEIKKLRKSAKKFLYNENLSVDEKIDTLFHWWYLLDASKQKSLALNDYDARLMKIKDKGQKYPKFSYNSQLGTDTVSKLICGVNVVQNPTDHYQIPALMNQILNNLDIKPKKVSADSIYRTLANLDYLDNLGIKALIPTAQQNRKNTDNQPENLFAIDYFEFNEYKNVFICPNGQELTLDGKYPAPIEKGGGRKIKAVYSNYKACQKCPDKEKCYNKNHRSITRYEHEATDKTEKLMNTEEGKKDYKLRSATVEAHNGTFKQIYHYDHIPITGLKRVQGLMFTIVASYNLIRLYNLLKENEINIKTAIEKIKTITKN